MYCVILCFDKYSEVFVPAKYLGGTYSLMFCGVELVFVWCRQSDCW